MTSITDKLIYSAYRLDGSGLREDSLEGMPGSVRPDSSVPVWYDMNSSHPDASEWLQQHEEIPDQAIEVMTALKSRPRFIGFEQGFCLVLRGVNLNEGAEVDDMISLRIWVSRNQVITSRRRALKTIEDTCTQVEQQKIATLSDCVEYMIDALIGKIELCVDAMNDDIAELEALVEQSFSHADEVRLNDIRKQSIAMLRYLQPQKEALDKLQREERLPFTLPGIRNIYDDLLRAVEDLHALKEQSLASLDLHYSMVSRQQSGRLYLLSVISIIFLPLTFISGLLGMNVGGIPGGASPLAFWLIVSSSVAIAVGLLVIFKYSKWF